MTGDGGRGWFPLRALADPQRRSELVERQREATMADDDRVAATLLARTALASLVWAALPAYLGEARVPDFTPGNTELELSEAGHLVRGARMARPQVLVLPGDAGPVPGARAVVATPPTLRLFLEEEILEAGERFLVEALAPFRVSSRVLHCELAVAWYAVVRRRGGREGQPAAVVAEHWRDRPDLASLMARASVPRPEGGQREMLMRTVCCLEYRAGPVDERTYCGTCPLVPLDVRVARREELDAGRPVPSLYVERRSEKPTPPRGQTP